MSIFGWDLPPGCSINDLPGNQPEEPCNICLSDLDHCICPECPVCGAIGNSICYEIHGLERSDAQLITYECNKKLYEAERIQENEMYDQMIKDIEDEKRQAENFRSEKN